MPTTRRSTRSSTLASSSKPKSPSKMKKSPTKSPVKKKTTSSPKRTRRDKDQPRIDESLNANKPPTSTITATGHSEDETQRTLSQDGVDGEIQMQVQLKSGIKPVMGKRYEILGENTAEESSPFLNRSFDGGWSTSTSTPILRDSGANSAITSPASTSTSGWDMKNIYYSPTGSSSRLGSLLSSPLNSSTASTSSYYFSPASTTTSTAALTDLKDDEKLEILRQFDLNMGYGACRGMCRRERYERALRFQLKPVPSPMILQILDEHKNEKNFNKEYNTCIWDQKLGN